MKFTLALLTYLVMSFFLGWGILLLVSGKPALLVVSLLIYLLAFAKAGCLPGKAH